MCKGGVWGSGPQTDKHLSQSLVTGQFFSRWRHFALPSMSLIFLRMLVCSFDNKEKSKNLALGGYHLYSCLVTLFFCSPPPPFRSSYKYPARISATCCLQKRRRNEGGLLEVGGGRKSRGGGDFFPAMQNTWPAWQTLIWSQHHGFFFFTETSLDTGVTPPPPLLLLRPRHTHPSFFKHTPRED